MNASLESYLVAVRHPNVSPFEHLEMLMIRDSLAEQEHSLNKRERACMADADRRLLKNAVTIHAELTRITSLEEERRQRSPSSDHWWWYLDVLSALPDIDGTSTLLEMA
ncbi:MAG: hypothetical protein HC802_21350 [Caldilineaceae bacterium]|nr:hypothetical protein [Caldilineaceae bacterium]